LIFSCTTIDLISGCAKIDFNLRTFDFHLEELLVISRSFSFSPAKQLILGFRTKFQVQEYVICGERR
jgi:hypothetical protein